MSVIKARTRGRHFVEYRTRLDRENHETLYAYAAFLNEAAEYVLNQLIETVLEKDREFMAWRAEHAKSYAPPRTPRAVRPRTSGARLAATSSMTAEPPAIRPSAREAAR